MHNDPKITVLMPAYNAGSYIAEAIASVLKQSFTDFELLIVNDGSTDDTVQVINSFNDKRIVLISQENKGIAAALNVGLKAARAPYIARFDADDVCYPNRLKMQYEFITTYPEYSVIGSAADYMDVKGHFIFTYHPEAHLNEEIQQLNYTVCPFIHSSVFYKKEIITNNGGYNEHAYTFEDHFLWVNILKHEKACNLSLPLIKVRLNPNSITIDEKWRTRQFRDIKYTTLKTRSISAAEGNKLLEIGQKQHSPKIREGAYYALLAKKFLWNNYQPAKARENLKAVLQLNRFDWKSYALFALTFMPENFLLKLYTIMK